MLVESSGRRSGVARSRTAVLWALASFIGLQMAFYPLADAWPQLHDGEFGGKMANLRTQLAAKPAGQPCVVMLGSSLTGWAFNPSELKSVKPGSAEGPVVFNFAINSGGVVVELLCLRRLLARGVHPDLLLLETHPQYLFRPYNTVPGEHYLQVLRLWRGDLGVLRRYDPSPHALRQQWRAFQWTPWLSHRHNLQNYLLPNWVRRRERIDVWSDTDRNGWEYMPRAIAHARQYTRQQIVASIQQRVDTLNNGQIEETFKLVYREIIQTCQKKGIPIVLVRMPEASYARARYTQSLQQQVEAFYSGLSNDLKVPIIDARDWVDDDDFSDGFHVQPRGAVVFTQRLERQFLGSFLSGRPPLAASLPGATD